MSRVLFVARAPFISGAERALLTLVRLLGQSGVATGVVLGNDPGLGADIERAGGRTWVVPLPRRSVTGVVGWWKSVRRIGRVVSEFRPDVIHANEVPACQAASVVGRAAGVPLVVHVRWPVAAHELGWWARSGAAAVVCISRWVREQLGDLVGTAVAKAEVLTAADPIDWAESAVSAGGPRRAETRLGFAGQLIESKGLDLLINALADVPAGARPRLMIAGRDTQTGGRYRAHLEDLARARGVADRVQWLGFLDDVGGLYREVDAVVCPSRVEPLGLVPLEAARYRLPAIASRVGGLAETIVDGRTGLLVPPTVEGWAERLADLPAGPELRTLGQAAFERARTEYSCDRYRDVILDLYRRISGVDGRAWMP